MTDAPSMQILKEFFFNEPLYSPIVLKDISYELAALYNRYEGRVDGHCPFCHMSSTFKIKGQYLPAGDPWNNISSRHSHDNVVLECARNQDHILYFHIRILNLQVQKIGQYPSLADIANDESKKYRSVLTKNDSSEFHKAIGLAAHGVGIGSYVYLRRIFENLILGRYQEFKDRGGWKDEEFFGLRMKEKIDFLKDYLPAFLVDNKGIYSILSLGIHELSEEKCLAYFEVMKHSIIIILEEDKKKKEEAAHRDMLAKAIATFGSENL